MGGKTGTTTSQVSIPPDVLARYNSVNAQAQQVAATPFQPYTGQFVAGLTPTQQAGIQATSQYSQAAQPYFQAATGQLAQGQGAGQQAVQQAFGALGQGVNVGQQYGQTAGEYYGGAAGAAMPYYGAMQQGIGGALAYAQPLNTAAQQAATSATGAATPYYQAATQGTAEAVAAAQPYQEAARQGLGAALQYSGGINQAAPQLAYSSYGAAQPIMGQALSGTQAAQQAGAPYQQASTQAALSGAQGVNPEALNIGAYMSPYTQSVADATFQALRQQQQQEMAGQTANAIRSGAFGGDRAALAAANLARQQQLATAQAMAPIYQQGFGQALAAAQQQQGVGLSAAQANRAAMQNLAAQLQGIGQQGYAQQLGAAGQIGQLGQNIYGQGLGTAQALSQMGQTGFGQQLQAAQAQAALGQQAYGQQLGAAQQFGNLGQNIYGMGANQANLLSQLGQTGYGQQLGAAQQYGNIGQNLYTMGMGTGQAMQGLGQQQFAQGLGAAQQLGALGQQQYGMGTGTAQQLAALGTGAQQAGLQGAQAQMGAGTLEQQTQQADLTARYQQFLQERGYPFQVAQFLANIAMGTGALSGSTTTTTQPMPFFSDRRVKDDVKEIGKTHDGQPIYSFKYKGDDSTQIGLMAQDVEKKHPEAVGEYGGIKTVDYKEATKDAERSERYAGGLVPESQGGAVTAPGAYNRGGYANGGFLTDPNDIQALLQQQQSAFGPFGEGGVYGGSPHEAPFAGAKGVVPQSRLHVPKMLQAGAPPKMPEGMGAQALEAYDQAMGMKRRYDEAKKMFGGEETPQQAMDKSRPNLTTQDEVKNLAGPDIKAPSTGGEEKGLLDYVSSFFKANGGAIPRPAYAVGGMSKDPSLPYEEDDKTPYKYFPTEILETDKPELAKANTPSGGLSQTGIGLGDVAKIASMFFLKDGGVVPRHGYATRGAVYDPTLGRTVDAEELTPEKIAELNKEDVYSRELQPAVAGRFRTFERMAREQGADVKPTELFRTPERSAYLDLTMPEGAPRAKPYSSGHSYGLAGDFSGITNENLPAVRSAAAATGLTLGEDFKNPDRPHVQYTRGSFGGLAPQYGQQIDLPPGSKDANLGGVVPPQLQEAAYAKAREVLTSKGVKPESEEGQSMMPQVVSFLEKNQGWLVPFGAGLKGMVQSKSPFLGGALLEGIGTGMEAVGTSQQQLADLARTQAGVRSTLSGITGPLIGEFDKNGKLVYRPQYKYMPDFTEAPTEGLGETQKQIIEQSQKAVQKDPVIVKTDAGQYNWDVVPTSQNDATFSAIGFEPTGNPNLDAQKLAVIYKMQPDVAAAAIKDQKAADEREKQAGNTTQTKRETNALTSALMSLPDPGSVVGAGPGFDERTYAANVYNWVAKFVGAEPEQFDNTIQAKEIANKIKVLLGSRTTSQQGFTGEALAQDITRALPGGDMTVGARAEMLASMWIANQEAEDFARYYKAYTQKYKTAYGVNVAFQRDMGPRYDAMKVAVKKAIMPLTQTMPDGTKKTLVDENGQPFSQYNVLMNDKNPVVFDELVGMPGTARVFLGG